MAFRLSFFVFWLVLQLGVAGEEKKLLAESSSQIERFKQLDARAYGVLRAWRTDLGESANFAGPGDVITVEVKDFVAWVIWQTNSLGAFSDPAIDAAPLAVKEIIKNHAFQRAVELADVVKSGVRGDSHDLLFLLQTKGFIEYGSAFLDEKDGATKSEGPTIPAMSDVEKVNRLLRRIDEAPAAVVLRHVLSTSVFKDFIPFLPAEEAAKLDLLLAVERCRDQLWRQARTNLRLKMGDIVLDDIAPLNPDDAVVSGRRPRGPNGAGYEWFRFRLEEGEGSSAAWNELRRGGLLRRPVKLTLVSKFGDRRQEVDSLIKTTPDGKANALSSFSLEIASGAWVALAVGLFGLILGIFAVLAARTSIICDTNGCFRGDGLRPFSLARAQMSFWFLVVVGSSIFLWVATGQFHVLNETCLWLIGIGSGTALGSAVIAGSEPTAETHSQFRLARDGKESPADFGVRLAQAIIISDAAANAAEPGPEKEKLMKQSDEFRAQMVDFTALPKSAWRRVIQDWLCDQRVYSFHRYQMLVWTLVLGTVFVAKVFKYRELPTFDGTMLSLMGITSGTYLGFKLQGSQK